MSTSKYIVKFFQTLDSKEQQYYLVDAVAYIGSLPVGIASGKCVAELDYADCNSHYYQNVRHKILTVDEYRDLERMKYRIGQIVEVSEERWWDLYECLPPADWITGKGYTVFRLIEGLTDCFYTWGVQLGKKYYTLVEAKTFGPHNILRKVQRYEYS